LASHHVWLSSRGAQVHFCGYRVSGWAAAAAAAAAGAAATGCSAVALTWAGRRVRGDGVVPTIGQYDAAPPARVGDGDRHWIRLAPRPCDGARPAALRPGRRGARGSARGGRAGMGGEVALPREGGLEGLRLSARDPARAQPLQRAALVLQHAAHRHPHPLDRAVRVHGECVPAPQKTR
jgi:hypothetical protein